MKYRPILNARRKWKLRPEDQSPVFDAVAAEHRIASTLDVNRKHRRPGARRRDGRRCPADDFEGVAVELNGSGLVTHGGPPEEREEDHRESEATPRQCAKPLRQGDCLETDRSVRRTGRVFRPGSWSGGHHECVAAVERREMLHVGQRRELVVPRPRDVHDRG